MTPLLTRPGLSARESIPFDSTLSVELFEHITATMGELTEKEQATVKNITKGYGEVYAASYAFKELIARNPQLMARTIEAAENELSFHVALAPSLMVWALNQDWPAENTFYVDFMVEEWTQRCLGSA